jgi:hypothetical protein
MHTRGNLRYLNNCPRVNDRCTTSSEHVSTSSGSRRNGSRRPYLRADCHGRYPRQSSRSALPPRMTPRGRKLMYKISPSTSASSCIAGISRAPPGYALRSCWVSQVIAPALPALPPPLAVAHVQPNLHSLMTPPRKRTEKIK